MAKPDFSASALVHVKIRVEVFGGCGFQPQITGAGCAGCPSHVFANRKVKLERGTRPATIKCHATRAKVCAFFLYRQSCLHVFGFSTAFVLVGLPV